ncbi:MAG: flagellar biosynthetic protein FliP [Proteobacteria bacterium]|nr:flagellar biosynthetic protein FliP [Pseudomonadota bacterium]
MVSQKDRTQYRHLSWLICAVLICICAFGSVAYAQDAGVAISDAAIKGAEELRDMPVASTVRLLVMLTGITFLPAMILAMTPFLRFIIVFSMLRQAVGLQSSPPNQILIGVALFLTIMLMGPVFTEINNTALTPFMNGEMETISAFDTAMIPLREFMLANIRKDELDVMVNISRIDPPQTLDDLPNAVVISSYILSELKTAFIMGVKIYLPFLVIDVVVANILLGMGMMVLPPVIISLPFKILLFVLMDGWTLLIRMVSSSFYGL